MEDCNCTRRTVEICGDALDKVFEHQHQYRLKTKRHLSFERAVNQLIIGDDKDLEEGKGSI